MERGERATLVRICDPAGRTRGAGFVADDEGTVVTSHEAVDGLDRVEVRAPGGRTYVAGTDAITPLPEADLALVRTEGLGVSPLPVAARGRVEAGTYVRIAAHGWREARVLGTARVTYTAADRFHLLGDVLELAIGTEGSEALRRGGEAAGGPVLDAATGAVLGVLGTALHAGHRAAGLAVPLARVAAAAPDGPLAALLRRNAATVPAYGADLNLAGVLRLAATTGGPAGGTSAWPDPVERRAVADELAAFEASDAVAFALVGEPGTGRTTELRALAARRARGDAPAPTLWLRGADLRADDTSLADGVGRALRAAGRIVACSGAHSDMGTATPERVARLALDWGRPLLVLLDGPEEMPPALAHRPAAWTAGTVSWLRAHRARLVVACRPEHWEQAGALYPSGALHRPGRPAWRLPDALRIGDLAGREAKRAREWYGLPGDALAADDARHPLALRLLAEVREALPGDVPGRPGRAEVFAAHLDLMCLRVAVRIAAASRPALRGGAVRRLAARVAGRVHEAARRCLGPGQGELSREAFEELFPWATGWAPAVLTEGLLVPAGAGYRFAHEEFGDWIQGTHLDLDAALDALVHGEDPVEDALEVQPAPPVLPVPRHRIGPVLQALLLLDRAQGPSALARRLEALIDAIDTIDAIDALDEHEERGGVGVDGSGEGRLQDAEWWGARLLGETLLRVPDLRPYLGVLRRLAERVAAGSVSGGALGEFGPWFWERLRLGEDDRLDLLRRLVPADGPPGRCDAPRYLDAVALRLAADPRGVQPLLCRWFTDERPLLAEPGARVRPTVAGAAQALLYAHRDLAVDDLCEALVTTAHPRADELLAALAEDEPAALCRAVDRWAHDDTRPGRRVAAAAYGQLLAAHVTADGDRELLRYAARALLARPGDQALHGPALGLLVRDPHSRSPYLRQALAAFRAGTPGLPASALAAALHTHPEQVLAAFRRRLLDGGPGPGAVLEVLAEVRTPALARRAADLVRAYVDRHPDGAVHAAGYVDRRLEQGPAARAVLFPLVSGVLRGSPVEVRGALAPVLAAPGTRASRPLRDELLDVLLEYEQYESHDGRDLAVLDALLRAAALGAARRPEARTRELVHRTGLLLVRTLEGATCFDRRLVELAREVPGFAALVVGWLRQAPGDWAFVVGPSARRTVESLGGTPAGPAHPMPMRAGSRGHGSLRPA
ncbi:serine protease [Streptomyces sp. CB03238]|uniref:serine protease n=1 Tax=Streptomyces sp. CB03238 TaxID=1907777 RepID=UPI000A104C77|nr:serine protease [Streptomyces sp. CB03238]ORT54373.1 serine protease [Streptomyces sp. CB03238]